MKKRMTSVSILAAALLVVGLWILHFHTAGIQSVFPKWNWLQATIGKFGEAGAPAAPADEDPDNTKNEIPVHVAQVTTATLHQYVDGFGTISPRTARNGEDPGSANIVSPVAGIVKSVNCQVGQKVKVGDVLIQLDERLSAAAEAQAAAALDQAKASLAALKATPRPDQLQIAQLAVSKAQSTVEFAQKSYDRVMQLASEQSSSQKLVQQASTDLASAQNDLAVAQAQLNVLKLSPRPEELAQEQAKVSQAEAAFAAAKTQRQMTALTATIDATVEVVSVQRGDSVDTTRTLVQLVSMDRLWVDVDVPADQLPANAIGLSAQLLMPGNGIGNGASPASIVPIGKVASVSPEVDPRNGTVTLGVDIPSDAGLRPGQTVHVQIIAQEHKDCLAVPREAVVTDENGDSVIAVVVKEQATHTAVKIGLSEDNLVEVIADALKEGDKVVTAGAFGLPAATHVKIVE